MILKALCDYYERHRDTLPPYKKEFKAIDFVICIDGNGRFIRFEDMRDPDGGTSSTFVVERHVPRTSGITANFLYDKCSYVLGFGDISATESKTIKDNAEKLDCFKQVISDIYNLDPDNIYTKVLNLFYGEEWKSNEEALREDNLWSEITSYVEKKKGNVWFSFRYKDERKLISENTELSALYRRAHPSESPQGICLITGDNSEIVSLTSETPIVGSKPTAKLVAFQTNQGYDSYGKEQGANAPIGDYAEFAYTTALGHLLSKESNHSFLLASKTYTFWTSALQETTDELEDAFRSLYGLNSETFDSISSLEKVRSIFESIYTGKSPVESDDRFYILGLKPNSARIAVSYWAEIPLKEFCGNILKHFEDFDIVKNPTNGKNDFGITTILNNVKREGKEQNELPTLSGLLIKSIFEGRPYPLTLYSAAVRRIRTERKINTVRAAILKGTLNRMINTSKIEYMLNKDFDNNAYQCGRLFAVIEKLQKDALGVETIRECYLSAASTSPASIFPTLLRLSAHHEQKIDNKGTQVFFAKLKNEIGNRINCIKGFPTTLSLMDQGNFFLGYYQQREDLFKPKDSQDNEEIDK